MSEQAELKLITQFYTDFKNKNYEGMGLCYSKDVCFYDPVFQQLRGYEVVAMWRMLIERARSLEINFSPVKKRGGFLYAQWEASYPFGKTNRLVHNKISARFKLKDGLIIEHIDTFNLWSWLQMALGVSGILLGWSPMMKNKVRKEAQAGLKLFIKRKRLSPTKD